MHCPTITNKAHFPPNSLFIEATAAIHGVYNKQNTSKQTAPNVEILLAIIAEEPINIERVDTILSLAKNPEINAVHIFQFPKPNGLNTGAIQPAMVAKILLCVWSPTALN